MKIPIRRIATQLEFRQAVDLDDSIGGPPALFTLPLSVLRSKNFDPSFSVGHANHIKGYIPRF